MDLGDDDSALIHSKFHKAKRGLLASASSSTTSSASASTQQQSSKCQSSSSTTTTTATTTATQLSSQGVTTTGCTTPPPSSSSSSSSDATISADSSSTASQIPNPRLIQEEQQIGGEFIHPQLSDDQSALITPTGAESSVSVIKHTPPALQQTTFQPFSQHQQLIHGNFEIAPPQHIPLQLHQTQFSGGAVALASPPTFGTNIGGTSGGSCSTVVTGSPSSSSGYPSSYASIGSSGSGSISSIGGGPLSSSSSSSSSGIVGSVILGGPPPSIQPSLPMPGNIAAGFQGRAEQVFRFDSTDRERYLCSAISEEEEDVFSPQRSSPGPSPSAFSTRSYDSPHIVLDSPRITISPLRIEDSPPTIPTTLTPSPIMDSQNRLFPRVHTGLAVLPPAANMDQARCLFGVPSSPVSPLTPNTPLSPSPLSPHEQMFQQGILEELYRRRCHSDSDLPCLPDSPKLEPTDLSVKASSRPTQRAKRWIPHPLVMPAIKSGSLESDQSTPQDSPLDLSMKGSRERFGSTPSASCESFGTSRSISSLVIPPQALCGPPSPGVQVISPTTRHAIASRYNLEVSPVMEENRPGAEMGFCCQVCGQVFSVHDRLAKHMASRHKSKPHDPNKSYPCEVCHRSFARSDMLTRHVRLHTGVKPYTCKMCGQVFSRSDHLSTHQRTHTGEKPYKCPQCPYSACRRDMITRHLRTHTRNSSSSSSDLMSVSSGSTTTPSSTSSSEPIVDERMIKSEYSRPPSSSSSFAPESPTQLSPALNIGSLSVHEEINRQNH